MVRRRTLGTSRLEKVTVMLPAELASLLRMAARRRALLDGGKPSVSQVVLDILERHRTQIENEAQSEMRL